MTSRLHARRLSLSLLAAAVALALALLVAKMPDVLLHGRFWAEEGGTFARDLIGGSLGDATRYVYKGAHVVLTSWLVWIGLQLPLVYAPLVTTWGSVAALLLVVAQLAAWAREAGVAVGVIALGIVAFLFLPGMPEVAASATNLQWICSLSCLLMLLTAPAALDRWLIAAAIWAVLCGLTGVPSAMFAPLFVARGVVARSRVHLLLGLLLGACALVQLATLSGASAGARSYSLDPYLTPLALAMQTVYASVLPLHLTKLLGAHAMGGGMAALLLGVALIVAGAAALAVLTRAARRSPAPAPSLWLLAAPWLGISLINLFGAIKAHPASFVDAPDGGRYFLVGATCVLLLAMLATRSRERWAAWGAVALLCLAVVVGVARTAQGWPGTALHGPSWRAQIETCRARQATTCRVILWPYQDKADWTVEIGRERLYER